MFPRSSTAHLTKKTLAVEAYASSSMCLESTMTRNMVVLMHLATCTQDRISNVDLLTQIQLLACHSSLLPTIKRGLTPNNRRTNIYPVCLPECISALLFN